MRLYKHPSMRDIAFNVSDIYNNDGKCKVKLSYYVRLPESTEYIPLNISETLRLPISKVREWVIIDG